MPYYAVARGYRCGVYLTWDECKAQVSGYGNASYKKFSTMNEAQRFVDGGYGSVSESKEHDEHDYAFAHYNSLSRKPKPIYIDGASRGNGRVSIPASGYGVYYGTNDPRNRAVALDEVDDVHKNPPTNQRAELHAMRHALRDIKHHLITSDSPEPFSIHSDSQYTINCISTWAKNWKANGWRTSKNTPVANADIIKEAVELKNEVDQLYRQHNWGPLELHYVRGHSGDEGNENADRLANLGADRMENSI
ncbi:hypothetical protein KGF56_004139 [Candida oxycetoniae]|uniref:ribonuclease H n=1 Tax=Candida oxycetoniae TaxID=497107 RepID=A0AAI9SUS5_9ASCO|nr:uncharacterized protein KGF56_004139 [Candida oxycetoniae]KAI3403079.1 hypothetical protein KGF56_004139 [Candida oxycetoniae]